jgi:VIT1/CCC1 family predicted Fe2+/Mn2+ transporter
MKPKQSTVKAERWHRWSGGGGALRAIVFGANDGLVSNASLIIGVSGADPDPKVVLLAGVAGLLAGGFSMAAGEYISVRTQRELLEHQIALEKRELKDHPEEEIEELAKIYESKGVDRDPSREIARRILADPDKGLTTLVREELGLDPKGLSSPYQAAGASFLSFALGALVPLIPHILTRGPGAFIGTLVATGASLLAVGASMSLFTGKNPVISALRQAFIGALAAGATFLVGKLLGVAVS